MLKYVGSLISSVFSRKRSFDEEENDEEQMNQKKMKVETDHDDAAVAAVNETKPSESITYLHRVKVTNLPERELAAVKKLFKSMGFSRYKKAPTWDYAYINFDSESEARDAMARLEGLDFKKRLLKTEYVQIAEEDYRKRFQGKKNAKPEEEAEEDPRTPAERLADQVTPFHKLSYEEQLKRKNRSGLKHLMNLKKSIAKLPDLKEDSKRQISWAFEKGSLPCEVLDPIASPEVNGYRSKCEFTIGKNLEGEPTVGFLLGLYRHGITAVLEPSECLHVSDTTKKLAKAMEEYVRASDYEVYDRAEKTGVWRCIMTKTQRTGDVMVLIQMRAKDLSDAQIEAEKQKLIEYWNNVEVPITTLLLQIWDGDSNGITDKAKIETLTGDGYVYEELLGCRFRISSSAFFQVNTPATELLYAKCAEWCNIDKSKKTTLLDLCCGTGTIGITMAKSVDRVVGIEMVPEAIVDAKANAERNNITNASYYAAKVEDRVDVVANASNEEVVAVLDPPRNGVHASVVRAVRESPAIKRVIFISCDAKQALPNFISLCRPKSNRFKGMPFKPTRAVSIDLFPHTDHCELMLEFERVEETTSSE
ncbi:S-adenosyl-L-methionine-dependent methyltransferase [Radiomyces spectabilis]|uniref:S-adenosyl-L-methionine-dependent methyltransferase n=1 Tax=Radiomyces spectabilis TaxID=64574 RepID=UPI00221F953C|nr:S-adenosyl-L-methionine-dependent methyltransferase [Radiomyces spectabilis]KAI8384413.1 S-adenosyl-L-methionine-dependent methyltransferase [Radiomyces spectabilis]